MYDQPGLYINIKGYHSQFNDILYDDEKVGLNDLKNYVSIIQTLLEDIKNNSFEPDTNYFDLIDSYENEGSKGKKFWNLIDEVISNKKESHEEHK